MNNKTERLLNARLPKRVGSWHSNMQQGESVPGPRGLVDPREIRLRNEALVPRTPFCEGDGHCPYKNCGVHLSQPHRKGCDALKPTLYRVFETDGKPVCERWTRPEIRVGCGVTVRGRNRNEKRDVESVDEMGMDEMGEEVYRSAGRWLFIKNVEHVSRFAQGDKVRTIGSGRNFSVVDVEWVEKKGWIYTDRKGAYWEHELDLVTRHSA